MNQKYFLQYSSPPQSNFDNPVFFSKQWNMKHQHTLQSKHDVMYPDISYPVIPEPLYHQCNPYYSTSFIEDDDGDDDFFRRQQQQQMKQKQESVHVIDIDNQGKNKIIVFSLYL